MSDVSSQRRGGRLSMTACAMVMAVSLGGEANSSPAEAQAVDQIARYCQASWRNARIAEQEWDDCTQEAFAELLGRVSRNGLCTAIRQAESAERRELNRSIWCIVQRRRRAPRFHPLHEEGLPASGGSPAAHEDGAAEELLAAANGVLTGRQRQILAGWSRGESISEMARTLGTTPARVSDEKYKGLRKLRRLMGPQRPAG